MKRLILLIPFLFQTVITFAQTDSVFQRTNKWSAGLIVVSEQNLRRVTDINTYKYEFEPDFLSGIILKRHFKTFSVRSGIEYKKRDFEDIPPANSRDMPTSIGTEKEGMLRLGIEKGITFNNRYIPYIALDLVGYKYNRNVIVTGGLDGGTHKGISNTFGLGSIPTIGFEFLITERFSIALESRVRLIYMWTESQSEDLIHPAGIYKSKDERLESNFNRIGAITVNYNF